ncbi:hypothetical protein D3C79_692270 [compost metagenome]
MTATILDMAVLAGVGIEQRAQAITGGGRRWCDHPRVAKETVADTEVQAPARGQVRRRHRVGILVAFAHRCFTTAKGFAGLSLGETRGVITGDQRGGQKQRAETEQQGKHQES